MDGSDIPIWVIPAYDEGHLHFELPAQMAESMVLRKKLSLTRWPKLRRRFRLALEYPRSLWIKKPIALACTLTELALHIFLHQHAGKASLVPEVPHIFPGQYFLTKASPD